LAPSVDVPVILGNSPMVTSMAAPNRKPVMTAFERKFEIQPIFNTAISKKSRPVIMVIAATSSTASSPVTDERTTALPATAASALLGPVEICLAVPNSAYRIVPAAAA
jgi:hypothetical protein